VAQATYRKQEEEEKNAENHRRGKKFSTGKRKTTAIGDVGKTFAESRLGPDGGGARRGMGHGRGLGGTQEDEKKTKITWGKGNVSAGCVERVVYAQR